MRTNRSRLAVICAYLALGLMIIFITIVTRPNMNDVTSWQGSCSGPADDTLVPCSLVTCQDNYTLFCHNVPYYQWPPVCHDYCHILKDVQYCTQRNRWILGSNTNGTLRMSTVVTTNADGMLTISYSKIRCNESVVLHMVKNDVTLETKRCQPGTWQTHIPIDQTENQISLHVDIDDAAGLYHSVSFAHPQLVFLGHYALIYYIGVAAYIVLVVITTGCYVRSQCKSVNEEQQLLNPNERVSPQPLLLSA